ncbi:diaminohydroxyphosphoribosylaminopyrimidine deaminase [Marinospirillum celere]|uniref:Riboflavin biosynthesis protein RibD n=1 Tax=Marinospirillum celere TaxID=1122252 RepID=A0A1I1H7B7_9GAMM|nr:bifunctional diaminohydroxyphosphoribosylaminopyrimidine deaminase/5-amino-6-(5-phosphoribosylamino)uracil reductase RibD [Marinospirillum celere]SFC19605.1 diaminohydroxyphosphoribosylaminopyrimidine deaminase [Marinospirillum celere]
MSHANYMAQAIKLARKGWYTTRPNPRVGCVLVREGQILGEGAHLKAGEPHAEVYALRQAGERAQGADAYVTLEPCSHHGRTPPCAEALIKAGVKRVFVGMKDPNPLVAGRGLTLLQEAGIEVVSGLLQDQAEALNPGFIKRMQRGQPWVVAKQAMSLDGRTAMASGESQWITGAEARADVQRLRAASCAVVTGVNSLLADSSRLNVRDERFTPLSGFTQPLRVVLDSGLQTPPGAAIFQQPGSTLVLTNEESLQKQQTARKQLEDQGAEVAALPLAANGGLDLQALLTLLGERQCNQLLVEAGAKLTGAFVQQGLVDEFYLYIAAKFLGSQARGLLDLPGLEKLAAAPQMQILDVRALGQDWRFQLKRLEQH